VSEKIDTTPLTVCGSAKRMRKATKVTDEKLWQGGGGSPDATTAAGMETVEIDANRSRYGFAWEAGSGWFNEDIVKRYNLGQGKSDP
jgi:hypothetical protein